MEIKAIETVYKGYRFRSRLEARWAIFMDHIGINWKYETVGFEVNDDRVGKTRYLPDFKLDNDAFLEIKPEITGSEGLVKPQAIVSAGQKVIVMQGNPWPGEYMAWMTNQGSCRECYESGFNFLVPWPTAQIGICLDCGRVALHFLSRDGSISFSSFTLGPNGTLDCVRRGCNVQFVRGKIGAAYAAARQARFEHGETPLPPR